MFQFNIKSVDFLLKYPSYTIVFRTKMASQLRLKYIRMWSSSFPSNFVAKMFYFDKNMLFRMSIISFVNIFNENVWFCHHCTGSFTTQEMSLYNFIM